jgi:hypothetical protein
MKGEGMEFNFTILGLYVAGTVERAMGNPFKMSRLQRRKLAKRLDAEVVDWRMSRKIARIKALRLIAQDEGWIGQHCFGLKAAKEWVECAFDDYGSGAVR